MKVKKISDSIHQQVLGYLPTEASRRVERETANMAERFGLSDAVDQNEVVNLPLPGWLKTFDITAAEAVEMFGRETINRLNLLSNATLPKLPMSKPPHAFGWLVWDERSVDWHESYSPESDMAQVLDFETVEVDGEWYPICCVVLSDGKWYIWQANLDHLTSTIDYSSSQVVVGHNVSYDRSFLASEYKYKLSGNMFFDTMSAWIASRGFTNQQRALFAQREDMLAPIWTEETAKNGLADVYQFYMGKELDKSTRDGMVTGGMQFIRQNWAEVTWYCIKDVLATAQVFQHVYPEMRNNQPNDISLTAQLLLGNTWLPLSSSRFPEYYDKAEAKADAILRSVDQRLAELAEQVLESPTEAQLNSSVMDWTPALSGKNKGKPMWYRKCKGRPTIGSRIAPVLLGCTWFGENVEWRSRPSKDNDKDEFGWWTPSQGFIPHPEKRSKLVSDLFMQDMVSQAETGVLDAHGGLRELLLDLVSTINWTSLKKRVASIKTESPEGYPVVLPRLTVTGTVTRRCADNIWQVASNPKSKRIGTELKSMIEAPPGYKIVGADVDSQELWLASALGDASVGFCGSTPLGMMVLMGDKKAGTDPHTVVGREVGVSRDVSKAKLVYGTLYGQGFKGTFEGLQQALPGASESECKDKANQFLKVFKGSKSQYTRKNIDGLASEAFNAMEAIANSQCPVTPILGAKMTMALRTAKEFQTTKVNWSIQSSGVDYRDLTVLYLAYFFKKLKVDGKLLMTIHDEVRTLVKEESVKRAVYAIQLAHLCTRAFIIDALQLDCIPAGIAWHSSVDVDTVLRKNPHDPQVTPSQPDAIPAGYEVTAKDMLAWWTV